MKVECPKCHRKYQVEDYYIPIGGAPIKCPNCGNIFGVYVEPIEIPLEPIKEDIPAEKEETAQSPVKEQLKQEESGELGAMFKAVQESQKSQDTLDYGNIDPTLPNQNNKESELGAMFDATNKKDIKQPDIPPFAQTQKTEQTPELGAFSQPSSEPKIEPAQPETPPFAQSQSTEQTPELGAFSQPSPEPKTEPAQPDIPPFAQSQSTEQTPKLGAFSQPSPEPKTEPAQPDIPPFAQSQSTEQTPELGAFSQPSPEPKTEPAQPDIPPFAQSQSTEQTPELGAFSQPSPEPKTESAQPDIPPFAQSQSTEQTPELGAFSQPSPEPKIEPAQPETPPFAQSQSTEQTPELGAFSQPSPEPKTEPAQPDIKPETIQPSVSKRKVGAGIFESLLAGFNLPDNFKNLPPEIQKKHKNAIRLARQLAKDIMLYHKEEVEKGLQNGNLKTILKDEIEKSYKFYEQRIEQDIAQNTNYFIEALNKIIGKGNKIF